MKRIIVFSLFIIVSCSYCFAQEGWVKYDMDPMTVCYKNNDCLVTVNDSLGVVISIIKNGIMQFVRIDNNGTKTEKYLKSEGSSAIVVEKRDDFFEKEYNEIAKRLPSSVRKRFHGEYGIK
jgi:hypothetical protein